MLMCFQLESSSGFKIIGECEISRGIGVILRNTVISEIAAPSGAVLVCIDAVICLGALGHAVFFEINVSA